MTPESEIVVLKKRVHDLEVRFDLIRFIVGTDGTQRDTADIVAEFTTR